MDHSATPQTHPTLLVVDGHSLAFRAFYALPVDNFSTKDGQATNAVYGFLTMLSQVIETEKPDHIGIAFDVKGGTFRNELLTQYKGTREAAPEELLTQLPLIQQRIVKSCVRLAATVVGGNIDAVQLFSHPQGTQFIGSENPLGIAQQPQAVTFLP